MLDSCIEKLTAKQGTFCFDKSRISREQLQVGWWNTRRVRTASAECSGEQWVRQRRHFAQDASSHLRRRLLSWEFYAPSLSFSLSVRQPATLISAASVLCQSHDVNSSNPCVVKTIVSSRPAGMEFLSLDSRIVLWPKNAKLDRPWCKLLRISWSWTHMVWILWRTKIRQQEERCYSVQLQPINLCRWLLQTAE